MRSAPVLFATALSLLGCAHFPNARLIHGAASVEVVQGPVVCGPLGFKKVPLQARWGEYVRVTVTAPAALTGTAIVHANGSALTPVEWSASTPGAVILDTRFANEDPDQRFMLLREQPIDITLAGLEAAAGGSCEGAVFTVEHGPLVPDIDERAWVAELERRGGPELAARREAARREAEARRQAHYAAWEARRLQQAQLSLEMLAQAEALRQAHYAAWDARHQVNVDVQGEAVASVAPSSMDGEGTAGTEGALTSQIPGEVGLQGGGGAMLGAGGLSSGGLATQGTAGSAATLGAGGSVAGSVATQGGGSVSVAGPSLLDLALHADVVAALGTSGFLCAELPTPNASLSASVSAVSSAASAAVTAPALCPAGMVAVSVAPGASAPGLTAHVDETVRVNGTASSATEWSLPYDSGSWALPTDSQLRAGATVVAGGHVESAWALPALQLGADATVGSGTSVQVEWTQPSDDQLRGGTTVVAGGHAQAGGFQPSDAQLHGGTTVGAGGQVQAEWTQPSDAQLRGGTTVLVSAPPPALPGTVVVSPRAPPAPAVELDVVTPALVQLLFDVAALGGALPCPPPQPCPGTVHPAAPAR